VAYAGEHPLDGHRRLCYRLIDEHSVACAPSTVYRVLKSAGLLQSWEVKAYSKAQGFEQPTVSHEHGHIAILNIAGTFSYLPHSPVSLADAQHLVAAYVEHYISVRLHSAIGYITPKATLEGREARSLRRTPVKSSTRGGRHETLQVTEPKAQ
jgi:hypothetical protein